jgi:general L-amino acid transport system permease protein
MSSRVPPCFQQSLKWCVAPFYTPRFRRIIVQGVFLCLLVMIIGFAGYYATVNLQQQKIASGFGFLSHRSGFSIIQSFIPYSETSTYGDALCVGFVNTLVVAAICIPLATVMGLCIALFRLSTHKGISVLGRFYVEAFRNIPLLLWLFFFYKGVLSALPSVHESISFFNGWILLNGRGLYFPVWSSLGFVKPVIGRFNIEGAFEILPEMLALVVGLVLYNGAFIAENIRAGILSVPKGQWEASKALSLPPSLTMRYIIIPQSLRVVLPALAGQYMNIIKSSSLAAAIGYPDLVQVFTGTTLNQTGQALEIVSITLLIYLALSIITAAIIAWFNQKLSWGERRRD